jgi:hypothetical protein
MDTQQNPNQPLPGKADSTSATKRSMNVSSRSVKNKVAVRVGAISKVDDKAASLGTIGRRETTPGVFSGDSAIHKTD